MNKQEELTELFSEVTPDCATIIHKQGKPKMSMIPPIIFKCIEDLVTFDSGYNTIYYLTCHIIHLDVNNQSKILRQAISGMLTKYTKDTSMSIYEVLTDLCGIMEFGADKHGAYNYRKSGYSASLYLDAAIRHMVKDLEVDTDDESGLPHILHAITNLGIVYHLINGDGVNDLIPQQKQLTNLE